MAALPVSHMVSGLARAAVRAAAATTLGVTTKGTRLADCISREVVDDIFAHALKKQTGVSLRYMLDFGSNPINRQLLLSAQFLHKELPVRLAHRVAELENLPYGLSSKSSILKVRLGSQVMCTLFSLHATQLFRPAPAVGLVAGIAQTPSSVSSSSSTTFTSSSRVQ